MGKWGSDKALQDSGSKLLQYTVFIVVIQATTAICEVANGLCHHYIHHGIIHNIKEQLLEKLVNAPISFYDKTPKATIMRRFNGNVH
jgi:ABC-type multidrug transport system fused ATPase/permease subunit